jgi:DNA polymerase III delta prime subunit
LAESLENSHQKIASERLTEIAYYLLDFHKNKICWTKKHHISVKKREDVLFLNPGKERKIIASVDAFFIY